MGKALPLRIKPKVYGLIDSLALGVAFGPV
jgi:hypothetical protein